MTSTTDKRIPFYVPKNHRAESMRTHTHTHTHTQQKSCKYHVLKGDHMLHKNKVKVVRQFTSYSNSFHVGISSFIQQ